MQPTRPATVAPPTPQGLESHPAGADFTTTGSSTDAPPTGSIVADERLRFEFVCYPADSGDRAPITVTSAKIRGPYWEA
ncbi:hypothetical protein ABS735_02260 [Streptomyces sp. MMCC 100]|uniref:hypothetical protein n=1 Tax=Streptomyces sp. MMCC 100 TaxID=3163555 RepID=UPI00359AFE59